MKAFVTADNKFAVSNKKRPLAAIPAERKTLFETVRGKTVVYESWFLNELPGRMPLRDCNNYILTEKGFGSLKGANCFDDIGALRDALLKENDADVMIIAGASLYNAFYDDIDTFHVTKIDYEYTADEFMPDLDKDPLFEITADSDELYCFDIIYHFLKYARK